MFEGPVTGNIPEVLDNGEVTDSTHVTAGQLALALTPYAQVTDLAVNTAAAGNNAAAIQSLDDRVTAELASKLDSSALAPAIAPLATAAALATTDGQVAAHGSSIAALQSSLTTGLSNKADQSAFDVLEGVVATKSTPDGVDLKLSNYSTTAAMNGSIASANNATLATVAANYGLKTVVDQHSLDIAARITPLEVDTKVANALLGSVTAAALASELASRDASISGLQASKADASALTAYALQSAVDTSSEVDSKIAAALLSAVTTAALDAALLGKADASALASLLSTVDGRHNSSLAGLLHLLTSGHSVGWETTAQGQRRTRRRPAPSRPRCWPTTPPHKWTRCWETTARRARRTRRRRPPSRARCAGLPDGPGPGRVHHQPNHLGAGGVPFGGRPGHGDGLEHRRRAAQLLHHRTSRRPPRRQARSHGGGLGPANSRTLSGRRRGRQGGGRHRRADPGPHGRLAVKLDGSPQHGPGHAHRGSERGRLHPDPGGEPTYNLTPGRELLFACRYRLGTASNFVVHMSEADNVYDPLYGSFVGDQGAWSTAKMYFTVPPNGVAKLHFGAHFPGRNPGGRQHGGGGHGGLGAAAEARVPRWGADDVTLATLGEVLLEPTLTTLGNFLVRSNSQSSVALASFAVGGFQLKGYAMTLSAFAWNIVRTYTLTPGRRYSFGCRCRLGTASNLVMYVSAADNDYVGVTGTFLGTPSQGVWSTTRLNFSVPPGGIAKLHFGAFGGSIPGLAQQSAGTLDLYSMQIRASAFEGESVSVTDLLADSLALTGSATLDGLTAQGNVGCDQLLCNDVNCTDVFTTGVDASGAVSCAALTATGAVAGATLSSTGAVSGSSLSRASRARPAWAC